MEAFRAGQIDILVTTTVIEVGVHVENASHPWSRGRGPVRALRSCTSCAAAWGRGSEQAYCFLVSETRSEAALTGFPSWWRPMTAFKSRSATLPSAAPGDLYGTRQHGASSVLDGCDLALLGQAAQAAQEVHGAARRGPMMRCLQ